MASIKKLKKQVAELQKSFAAPGMSADPATARMFGPMLQSNTGLRVTPWTSLGSTVVYACVRALSEDMARVKLCVERKQDGGWVEDSMHPLHQVLRKPNKWQNSFDFIAYMVACYAHRGNGYAVIIRDGRGVPNRLVPISPDRTQVMIGDNGNLFYSILHQLVDDNQQIVVPSDDIIHIRGMSVDGYTGVSPISIGQEAIGLSLAAQTHGAKTFANGTSLRGVLESPQTLSKEASDRMSASWRDMNSGIQNAGKVAVLEQGVKFNAISMSLEDAQYLDTRAFQVIDLCRLFRVPPHKVMELSDAHYANTEQMNQEYMDNALLPIAMRIEQEMEEKLLFDGERASTRINFNFDDMLRADQGTRFKTYATATTSGILSINECRELEGLGPVNGGDEHRTQIQNQPITALPNPDDNSTNPQSIQDSDNQGSEAGQRSSHQVNPAPTGRARKRRNP